MRTLALLLAVTAPLLAQDDAAALFYRGFWLEQAEGKLDEAAALYAELLKEKPDAPEAPRALLGLVRIKVARNEDPKDLVAELERRYPAAKAELEDARKAATREEFKGWPPGPDDPPILVKLKTLHWHMSQGTRLDEPDRLFLVDLGAAAHPMLSQLLRAPGAGPAAAAAGVLVAQRTPEAYALLARALLDDTALFRSAIVTALRDCPDAARIVVEALGALYGRSAPRLRAETVLTLVRLASREGDGREAAFALLVRALADEDQGTRFTALGVLDEEGASDAYVDAALRLVEGSDAGLHHYRRHLPRFADRPVFRERIEKALEPWTLSQAYFPAQPPHEEGALVLARKVIRDLKAGRRDDALPSVARMVAAVSPRAAGLLLAAALELDDRDLVFSLAHGVGGRDLVKYLGEEASRLRALAVAMAPGVNEPPREALGQVLGIVGTPAEDFQAVLDGLRRRGDRGLPAVLLDENRLRSLGPANAGALAGFCRDEGQLTSLLGEGWGFAKREDKGVEFFRQVVPRTGPSAAPWLREVAKVPELAPLVADRLLAARGPEWKWNAPRVEHLAVPGRVQSGLREGAEREHPGPWVWFGVDSGVLQAEPLRTALLACVQDPRAEIAESAARAASSEKGEAETAALKLALESNVPAVRAIAFVALAPRVPDGPAFAREFARRDDLGGDDRAAVARVLSQGPAYAPVAAELLRLGTWPELWPVYQQIAPLECVNLALAEAGLGKDARQRSGAVGVLVAVEDPRRIDAFRAVLKGADRAAITKVLVAVRDQYLVELGEETLAQLRNPDEGIRRVAGEAIERLKFYAEAKKAFQK